MSIHRLIINTDCASIKHHYHNNTFIAAAVVRTPDGTPKMAILQKIANPPLLKDEEHMCLIHDKVSTARIELGGNRNDDAYASTDEARQLIETAKRLGILIPPHSGIADDIVKTIAIHGIDEKKLINLQRFVGKFIRYEYGMRKICEVILEGELYAFLLGLHLVDDHIPIVIKSDSSDGVDYIKKVIPAKPPKTEDARAFDDSPFLSVV